ncbi:unnamed protein product [Pieris macdunnoughi]|uniref:Uncharacterized protein n=1 Tax=Pieris macdunnoughi TaxID=345717 RepID=A0A821WGV2_9NEOP|nr:unnamed protein product [Pieris macdunnoughi]
MLPYEIGGSDNECVEALRWDCGGERGKRIVLVKVRAAATTFLRTGRCGNCHGATERTHGPQKKCTHRLLNASSAFN